MIGTPGVLGEALRGRRPAVLGWNWEPEDTQGEGASQPPCPPTSSSRLGPAGGAPGIQAARGNWEGTG